jgi:hypothetical protein
MIRSLPSCGTGAGIGLGDVMGATPPDGAEQAVTATNSRLRLR